MSVNHVYLLGSVGKDPEVKDINGTKCATFTLATNETYKDRNGEKQTNTEWHTIVCWRNTADIVERFVKKGMQLFVEGKIKTRSWDDQSGNKRYVTEIVADSVQMLGKKEESSRPAQHQEQRPVYRTTPIVDDLPPDDDGLPF
jgi:single-strand DNA-binding protein